jgi:sodium transport system permease protein
MAVAMFTIVLALISIVISFQFLMPKISNGTVEQNILFSPSILLITLGIAFLLTLFMSAIEMAISIYARSFKEAQNYLTPLYIVAILPAMIVQFAQTLQPSNMLFLVPILNAMLLLKELFIGQVNCIHIWCVLMSLIVYSILALNMTFKFFLKEEVLFRS